MNKVIVETKNFSRVKIIIEAEVGINIIQGMRDGLDIITETMDGLSQYGTVKVKKFVFMNEEGKSSS